MDEAAEKGLRFVFEIKMRWTGAEKEFEKAKQAEKDYLALFSDAAQTDRIYHIGLVDSMEVSKTTKIELKSSYGLFCTD